MEWFGGGVLNAISTCRQERALFVVYISDDSEASQATLQAWNSDEVLQFLKSKKWVALKVMKNSTEFNQFSQFFAVFTFPSVYCIDLSGKPLVVMNGKQTSDTLKSTLNEAFMKMEGLLPNSSASNPSGHVTSTEDTEVSPERELASPSSASASPTSAESKPEKLKRYEEKIKQRRQERSDAAKQQELDSEKDRRTRSKDVTKFREMQAEQHNKNWLRERQKEKEDARLAKEEVRAKLEQDRREREEKQQTVVLQRQRSQKSSSQQSPTASQSTTSRIQLRLPTGSSEIVELRKDATLGMLRERISDVLDVGSADFSLTRLYPRLELTVDMELKTMVDLELAPTGVIIIKMKKKFSASNADSNWLWAPISFIVWIFTIIKEFMLRSFSSNTPQEPRSRQSSSVGAESRLHKFRQEDYKDDEDSDDMGTYNGNSTQQQ